MAINVRPARAEDLDRAGELVVRSMNHLSERHGFGPMASVRPPKFLQFSLADDPDGLWIAEDGDDILGFGFSWRCDGLWFLAQLFVAPVRQAKGVGRELLNRTLQHAQKSRATTAALITFPFNTVSQGLYMRHGFIPRWPIYNFGVSREKLRKASAGKLLRWTPLASDERDLEALARIDAESLGVSRRKHHGYLLGDSENRGVLLRVRDGGEPVGYAYIADGHIGPLAVTKPELTGPAFRTALDLAAESGSRQISAFLPAPSQDAWTTAMEHGMRITIPMLMMSTREFGDWSKYLPRNPGFM